MIKFFKPRYYKYHANRSRGPGEYILDKKTDNNNQILLTFESGNLTALSGRMTFKTPFSEHAVEIPISSTFGIVGLYPIKYERYGLQS